MASSKSPADPAPDSKALLYSVPVQIGSHRRTPVVYFPVLSFSAVPHSIEPLILLPPTAVLGRQTHIAELPNVLRSEPARVLARWPCAGLVVSAAFAPRLLMRPAAHLR